MRHEVPLVYLSYAPQDAPFAAELRTHLQLLVAANEIEIRERKDVEPGEVGEDRVAGWIDSAKVFVALLSADYLISAGEELRRASARRASGTRLLPILTRACLWDRTELGSLEILSDSGKPVALAEHRDTLWVEATRALGRLLSVQIEVEAPSLPEARSAPATPSAPRSRDAEARRARVAVELEEALARRRGILALGEGTGALDEEILRLKRALREGGELRAGDSLGGDRYHLLRRIGRGGSASVWEALDREKGERVAIKVLHPGQGENARERFERGAKRMSELQHPAVVKVLEPATEDVGFCFFAMELVVAGDLRRAVLDGKIGAEAIVPLILQVGSALSAAHGRGFVHRDVKPANILLDASGAPKLTDFDLVAAEDTTGGTRTGAMGTYLYAAPEALQDAKTADARADVYGLGMTAVFCFHGADLPFAVQEDKQAFLAELRCEPAVREVLRKAVASKRESRFASVEEMCRALGAASDEPDARVESAEAASARTEGNSSARPHSATAPGLPSTTERLTLKAEMARLEEELAKESFLPSWRIVGAVAGAALLLSVLGAVFGARFFREGAAGADVAPLATDALGDTTEAPRGPGTAVSTTTAATTTAASTTTAVPVVAFVTESSDEAPAPSAPTFTCPPGMIVIPEGVFSMGRPAGEAGSELDETSHLVRLSGYCIDRTEVTVGAYRECVNRPMKGKKPCSPPPRTPVQTDGHLEEWSKFCNAGNDAETERPMNCVDWSAAEAYCRWAGKRLPTEAEWERAAAGPRGRKYPWGDQAPDAGRLNACGGECGLSASASWWPKGRMFEQMDGWPDTAPVGRVEGDVTAEGVHDMGGNVIEWVADYYGPYPKSESAVVNPINSVPSRTTPQRAARGGGWLVFLPSAVRTAKRHRFAPEYRGVSLGFRCASSPKIPKAPDAR